MEGLKSECYTWVSGILSLIPEGQIGIKLRRMFYKKCLRKCGNVTIFSGVSLRSPKTISLGDGVHINRNVSIDASYGDIPIGDDVMIAHNTVIHPSKHKYKDRSLPIIKQGIIPRKTVIEDGVWIGANSVILCATIGKNAVIGAGAVVTKDVLPFTMVLGVPANRR